MNYLHQIPLARLVIPLIIGIATALYLPVSTMGYWFYGALVLLIALMIFLSNKGRVAASWFGLVTTLFFVLTGIYLVEINTVNKADNYFGNHLQKSNYVVASINKPTEIKDKSVKAYLEVESVKTTSGWQNASGSILTYFEPNDMSYALAYGDKLVLNIGITEIKPPLNPGQFNYKAFLARKGIYHQAYVKETDYTLIESHAGNPVYNWIYNVRDYMYWLLGESGLQGQQRAVASALVLGYDDDIESDLLQAYSASGTLHVLSVSGMHAALVFGFLMVLLSLVGQSKTARIARAVIIIVSLWIYALLTGFSPPVVRAAVMFSLLAIGRGFFQHINNFNILAGSCLIMLIANPYLLADVGFQLSYSAVLGIGLFFPCIHRFKNIHERIELSTHRKPRLIVMLIKIYNWLASGAWTIIAVSLAAQLATLPLGLYYFHQFPVYFIAANLIIIPLSILCIWGGMILLIVSWIPYVGHAIGWVLNNMVHALNDLAIFSERLPQATWSNFKLYQIEVLVIYIIIILTLIALKSARKQLVYATIILAIVFMGFRVFQKSETLQQHKLVIYNISKASAVEVIEGNQSLLIADTSATPGTTNYKFNIVAGEWYFGIKDRVVNASSNSAYHKLPVLVAGDKTILLYNQNFKPRQTTIQGKTDYIIVSGNPYLDYKVIEAIKPKMVIFDGSNKASKLKYWLKKLDELNIPYHNTVVDGAFILNY